MKPKLHQPSFKYFYYYRFTILAFECLPDNHCLRLVEGGGLLRRTLNTWLSAFSNFLNFVVEKGSHKLKISILKFITNLDIWLMAISSIFSKSKADSNLYLVISLCRWLFFYNEKKKSMHNESAQDCAWLICLCLAL